MDPKDKIGEELKKRVRTTMIGSLDRIESTFGFLWSDSDEDIPTAEEFEQMFQVLRTSILDLGNHQIRTIDSELNKYSVSYKRFKYQMPPSIIQRGN